MRGWVPRVHYRLIEVQAWLSSRFVGQRAAAPRQTRRPGEHWQGGARADAAQDGAVYTPPPANTHQVFIPLLFPSCHPKPSTRTLLGSDLIKVYICICLMNTILFFNYEPLAAASIGQGNRLNCIKCFFSAADCVDGLVFCSARGWNWRKIIGAVNPTNSMMSSMKMLDTNLCMRQSQSLCLRQVLHSRCH